MGMSGVLHWSPWIFVGGALGLGGLLFLFRRPDVALACFMFSYVIEGGDLLPPPFDLTPILLAVSLAGFVWAAMRGRPIMDRWAPSDIWAFALLLVLVGGVARVPLPEHGILKAGTFAVAVVLPYMMGRCFLVSHRQMKVFLLTIAVLSGGIAVALVAESLLRPLAGRMSFLGANPIPTGTLLAVGMIIGVIGLTGHLSRRSPRTQAAWFLLSLLCLSGILLSGVRGPLISALMGLLFHFLIMHRRRLKALVCGGVIVAALAVGIAMYPQILDRIPNVNLFAFKQIREGTSTNLRLELYGTAAQLFVRRPLLGVGTDGFTQRASLGEGLSEVWSKGSAQVENIAYPHNMLLEVASENGLIGLLFLFLFLGDVALRGLGWRNRNWTKLSPRERSIGLAVIAVGIALLVEKQLSYNLVMHKDLFVFLAMIVNLRIIKPCTNSDSTEMVERGQVHGKDQGEGA